MPKGSDLLLPLAAIGMLLLTLMYVSSVTQANGVISATSNGVYELRNGRIRFCMLKPSRSTEVLTFVPDCGEWSN